MKTGLDALKNLKELRDGNRESLQFDWSRLRTLYEAKNGGGLQLRAQGVVANLRARAVLVYLLDADRVGFFESCYQAALVYEYCNRLIKAGMPHDPNIYTVTKRRGLFDAFLTFSRPDLLRLLSTAPDEMRDEDDSVPFLFHLFLIELAEGKREGYQETLKVLREEAEKGEEADIEIGLCESLQNRDASRFVDAMQSFLDRRQGEIENREGVMLGEEYVSIEGLALRRLATAVGIEVQIRHRLTPIDLQENYPEPETFSRGEVPDVEPEVDRAGFWKGWREVKAW